MGRFKIDSNLLFYNFRFEIVLNFSDFYYCRKYVFHKPCFLLSLHFFIKSAQRIYLSELSFIVRYSLLLDSRFKLLKFRVHVLPLFLVLLDDLLHKR